MTRIGRTAAGQILTHFGLRRFFQYTYGSELDGRRSSKEELIAHVLAEESIQASKAVMVGDREHDVKGALANRVTPVGVLWGYGSHQELAAAGAILMRAGTVAGEICLKRFEPTAQPDVGKPPPDSRNFR